MGKIIGYRCPVCGSRMKEMYKPELTIECRKTCGLIVRVQNNEYDDKLRDWVLSSGWRSNTEVVKKGLSDQSAGD